MENSASDTDPIPRISEKVCFDANLESPPISALEETRRASNYLKE